MHVRFFVLVALFLAGCASTVARITGLEPVTQERCQAKDVRQMGFDDGKTGQRIGERFEFWVKDCAGVGVRLDRKAYDDGYAEGLSSYCSCENGFLAGVKDEYTEFKLQYLMCKKPLFQQFLSGHEFGKLQIKNEELSKKVGPFKTEFNEPAILALAKTTCAAAPIR